MSELPQDIVLTEIEEILTVSSPKGRSEHIHQRGSYGLSFCREGQITYTHKGVDYVSTPGYAIILPRGESYSLHGDKNGVFPVINFQCTGFICDHHLLIPIDNAEPYFSEYEELRALSFFEGNRLKMLSILYGMLHRLATPSAAGVLTRALNYIETHYSDPTLNNTELARQCRISEVYFRKLFARQYSLTPRQFIISIRISKARQLLTEGIYKISEISEQCGFASPYHFCRIFKSHTGLTPTEYSRKYRTFKI